MVHPGDTDIRIRTVGLIHTHHRGRPYKVFNGGDDSRGRERQGRMMELLRRLESNNNREKNR